MERPDVDFMCLCRGVHTDFTNCVDIAVDPVLFERFANESAEEFMDIMERAQRISGKRSITSFVSSAFYSSVFVRSVRSQRSSVVMEYVENTDASCRFFVTSDSAVDFGRLRINGYSMVSNIYGGRCVQNLEHYHYIVETVIILPLDLVRQLLKDAEVECCIYLRGARRYINNQISEVDYSDDISDIPNIPDRPWRDPREMSYTGSCETDAVVSKQTYRRMNLSKKSKVWFVY